MPDRLCSYRGSVRGRITVIGTESAIDEGECGLVWRWVGRRFGNLRSEEVQGSVGWGVIGKANFIRLVNENNVRAAIPAPVPRLRAEFTLCNLNYLAWPTFLEHPNHTATSGPTVHVDGQRSIKGIESGFNKPEESINGVILLYGSKLVRWKCNVTGVLLLSGEDCCTGANGRGFEADGNIAINWRVYGGDIGIWRYWWRVLSI